MKRVAILLSVLMMFAPLRVTAQSTKSSEQDAGLKTTGAAAKPATINAQSNVSVKIENGERLTLRNRFGPIIVTGGSLDTVEAVATVTKPGTKDYKFRVIASRTAPDKIMLTTAVTMDVAPGNVQGTPGVVGRGSVVSGAKGQTTTPRSPTSPPPTPPAPQGATGVGVAPRTRIAPRPRAERDAPLGETLRGVGEIRLEVKLPRNVQIELIDSRRYALPQAQGGSTPVYLTSNRSDINVTNLDTPISVISSGDVQITKVSAAEVRTRAGNVMVKDVAGLTNITTVTGAIIVTGAEGDVRASSLSGTISVQCARGRVEANTIKGIITLTGVGGDLDASTTGGSITFTGAVREGGRYRLRSMSGPVRMFIQPEPPGFLASLSSYQGQIQVDFPLKRELSANTATSDLPSTQGQPVRRVVGRYKDGDTRITLDSFGGVVQLSRASEEVLKKCR
jgi:hypothetical protein